MTVPETETFWLGLREANWKGEETESGGWKRSRIESARRPMAERKRASTMRLFSMRKASQKGLN